MHYSEPDAGESYFKAVLSNTKEKLKLFQKGNSFKVKNMQRQILRKAAWKYEYLSAYLAQ